MSSQHGLFINEPEAGMRGNSNLEDSTFVPLELKA